MMMKSASAKLAIFSALFASVFILSQVVVSAAPGDLDTSFGVQGQVTDTTFDRTRGTVVQSDGKVIVVGSMLLTVNSVTFGVPAVARFNADGSPDTTFGTGGSVIASSTSSQSGSFESVIVQSDGKIVAVGGRSTSAFVVRLNTDGSFDTSFSGDGKLAFSYSAPNYESSRMKGVGIASGGKVVLAGSVTYVYDPDPYANRTDVFIARLDSDGTFDSTFGTSGKQIHHVAHDQNDVAESLAIHPTTGKLALALPDDSHMYAMLLNSDGSRDTNFGNNGVAKADFGFGSLAKTIAFQRWNLNPGGLPVYTTRIVVGGWAYESSISEWDFALARFNLDGSLDTGFNGSGKVRKALSYQKDMIRSIRIDSSARIVAVGPRRWNNIYSFAVVRFTRDGAYDTTFGNGGKVYTTFDGFDTLQNEASAAAIGPDGKIVAAGGYAPAGNILLARYEP